MTECETDYKCPYCKGTTSEKPLVLYGHCREGELLERIYELEKALTLYADPGFYHGCAFQFDRPTGGFDEDFSENDLYDYPKPGKLARAVLLPEPPE